MGCGSTNMINLWHRGLMGNNVNEVTAHQTVLLLREITFHDYTIVVLPAVQANSAWPSPCVRNRHCTVYSIIRRPVNSTYQLTAVTQVEIYYGNVQVTRNVLVLLLLFIFFFLVPT